MGLFKAIYYLIISTAGIFLILNHTPNLLDIEPQAYTPKLLKYEGALAVNKDLDKAEIILKDEVLAPEALAYNDGEIYASLANGRIVSIKNDKVVKIIADTTEGSRFASRPLGLRCFKEDVYFVDAHRGLLKANIKTGKVTELLSMSMSIGGRKISVANDMDISDDGVIYFSDVSAKWTLGNAFYSFLEHENSGRVISYDVSTKSVEVILDNLYLPNGIQLTHDKKSLLVAEMLNSRILKYHLSGPKKGQKEVFAELPGEPDNIRLSSRGGYWVAVLSPRDASSPLIIDRLASYPKIRKALARLSHVAVIVLDWANQYLSSPVITGISSELKSGSHFLMLFDFDHPVVVELGPTGKIVRSLHGTNSKFGYLSQGLEINGDLYLGSFIHPYIVKLKL